MLGVQIGGARVPRNHLWDLQACPAPNRMQNFTLHNPKPTALDSNLDSNISRAGKPFAQRLLHVPLDQFEGLCQRRLGYKGYRAQCSKKHINGEQQSII